MIICPVDQPFYEQVNTLQNLRLKINCSKDGNLVLFCTELFLHIAQGWGISMTSDPLPITSNWLALLSIIWTMDGGVAVQTLGMRGNPPSPASGGGNGTLAPSVHIHVLFENRSMIDVSL
jgi:hypothetical protein